MHPRARTLSTLLLLSALACVATGFGKSRPPAELACAQAPMQFDVEIAAAITELGGGKGRRIAADREALPEAERKRWIKWAERKLKEAQTAAELAENDPRLRGFAKDLSKVTTHLVEFYGYAQAGNTRKMLATLEKVRKHGGKAAKSACKPV